MSKAILILPIVAIALSVIPIPIGHSQTQNQTQIQTQTDCKQQGLQLTDRYKNWDTLWTNATSDPGGSIRADGRHIVSDITTFLINCQGSYDKSTFKFFLTLSTVMTAEIAGNVNYGPPCTPTCASGPPVT